MAIKMQVFFSMGRAGWSETYYRIGSFDSFDYAAVAFNFTNVRRPLLASNISLDAIKFSDFDAPRKVFVVPVDVTGPFSTRTPGATNGDMPFTAVLVNMPLFGGSSRRVFLRGLRDSITIANNGVITDATWLGQFAAYRAYLIDGVWAGATLLGGTNLSTTINDIVLSDGKIRLSFDNAGFVDGETVLVSRLLSTPDVNGKWTIKLVPLLGAILNGSNTGVAVPTMEPGGIITTRRYSLNAILDVQQVRFTSKRVGRPFGLPRSRRSRRQRRYVSPLV